MSRARSGITRRRVIAGAGASLAVASTGFAVAPAASAKPLVLRGGKSILATGPTIQTFTLAEHSNMSSLGFKQGGLLFEPADVPSGYRPEIRDISEATVPAQFDAVSTYPDGSIRFCTFSLRTNNFSANEVRSYSVVAVPGTIDNTSSGTLADITGATDFTIDLTAMVGTGITNGSLPDHAAAFNTHAAVPTRVTRYRSGSIVDSWEVWGMAANGGVDHPHLQAAWFVSRYKNADGSTAFYRLAVVMAQHWWSVANKEKLTYTATLKNGGTTIETYGGSLNSSLVRSATVDHCYGQQWAMVRLQNDNEHATPHCIGASIPTLLYKPDRAKWIKTGAVSPIDVTYPYVLPANFTGAFGTVFNAGTYQPGSAFCFNPTGSAPGESYGRGPMNESDSLAFALQTAAAVRANRVHSFAALHYPNHMRSNHTRIRPIAKFPTDGGASDTANTICALKLWDSRGSATPSSYYDCQADGMPAPVHAYAGSGGSEEDGWVIPTGGTTSGTTAWSGVGNLEHAYNWCYYNYLLEGERYLFKAMLDLGMEVTQSQKGGTGVLSNGVNGGMPTSLAWENTTHTAFYPGGSGSFQYAGVPLRQVNPGSSRTVGWCANRLKAMIFVPDNDVEAGFARQYIKTSGQYLEDYRVLIPSDCPGQISPGNNAVSPFMEAFSPLAMYQLYALARDTNWLNFAHFSAKMAIQWTQGPFNAWGGARAFHAFSRANNDTAFWNAVTNPFYMGGLCFASNDTYAGETAFGASIVAATNTFTQPRASAGDFNLTNGDMVVTNNSESHLSTYPPPPEMTLGQVYYMVNVNDAARTFQLSLTPGGAVHDFAFSQDYPSSVLLGYRLQDSGTIPPRDTNLLDPTSFAQIQACVVIEAYRYGHPDVDATVAGIAQSWTDACWAGPYAGKVNTAKWHYDKDV